MSLSEQQPTLQASTSFSPTDFPRRAQWSPDGSALLTTTENRLCSVYALSADDAAEATSRRALTPKLHAPCPSALVTAAWYPGAQAAYPATFCFLRSARDTAINLLDGCTGKIRASYPIIDHTERFIGPQSLVFTADGTRFYASHDNAIEEFDLQRPGPGTRHKTVATRQSRDGQKGILSSLALCPWDQSLLAVGSFSRSVGLYDAAGGVQASQVVAAQGSGVTSLKFHPSSPQLFVASRQSDLITSYDLRHTVEPVHTFRRPGRTNQRLFFDLNPDGSKLASGDQHGTVHLWSLDDPQQEAQSTFQAAKEAIPSVHFHPTAPWLAVASGTRNFVDPAEEDSSDESDGSSSSSAASAARRQPFARDSALRIWSLSSSSETPVSTQISS